MKSHGLRYYEKKNNAISKIAGRYVERTFYNIETIYLQLRYLSLSKIFRNPILLDFKFWNYKRRMSMYNICTQTKFHKNINVSSRYRHRFDSTLTRAISLIVHTIFTIIIESYTFDGEVAQLQL